MSLSELDDDGIVAVAVGDANDVGGCDLARANCDGDFDGMWPWDDNDLRRGVSR